jgi:hypothetical protein
LEPVPVPSLRRRPPPGGLLLLPQRLELVRGGAEPLEQVVVEGDEPVVRVVEVAAPGNGCCCRVGRSGAAPSTPREASALAAAAPTGDLKAGKLL